ncbi:MAG TPA: DUF262 domain-containing protein [Myxococcota bacterium]|nr:DUF262 domain-containing protein [Myxococcota bacterium]
MGRSRERTITVEEILASCRRWGVPHFQRGGVWDMGNRAALLESLFFDTPCGSVILWDKPDKEFGIPLYENGVAAAPAGSAPATSAPREKAPFDYLIIDGQQRTRSLMAAFEGIEDFAAADTEESQEQDAGTEASSTSPQPLKKYWSINLESLKEPGFKDMLDPEGKAVAAPLFVYTETAADWIEYRDKLTERRKKAGKTRTGIPPKRHLYNSIPLKSFFDDDIDARALVTNGHVLLRHVSGPEAGHEIKIEPGVPDSPEMTRLLAKLTELRRRVREMKTRKLFLKKLPRSWNLDQVIDIFIRINSGGRPVEEEERAFSQLLRLSAGAKMPKKRVPLDPELPKNANEWICDIFEKIHRTGGDSGVESLVSQRDRALARMNERAFGFKLFVRVFVLASSYHTYNALSKTSFSFGVLHEDRFVNELRQGNDIQIWKVVRDVVLATKELLQNELYMDSFKFLPSARALWPVFTILIRYADLMEIRGKAGVRIRAEYRAGLALMTLKLLLASPDDKKLMEYSSAVVAGKGDADACITEILALIDDRFTKQTISAALENANSLTSLPTLMLYGLERSRSARDFLYDKYSFRDAPPFRCKERVIDAECSPEKQHIVPYSIMAQAYGLSGSRRSTHVINNVGNITYISHDLNGLDGLSDEMLVFDGEPADNLDSHMLFDAALRHYNAIKDVAVRPEGFAGSEPAVQGEFEAWVATRRKDIQAGFEEWIESFDDDWLAFRSLRTSNRVEPTRPIILKTLGTAKDLEHLIRELDLANAIEDKLVAIFASTGWKLKGSESNLMSLTLEWKPRGKAVIKGVMIDREKLVYAGGATPVTIGFDGGNPADPVAQLNELARTFRDLQEASRAGRKQAKAPESSSNQ